MDGKAARSIEAILEEYNKRQRAERLEMELKKAQRDDFLQNFAGSIQSVIRPVMEQAAELLRRAGHDFEIVENSDGLQADGRTLNAAITLTIFPNGVRPSDPRNTDQAGWPHIAFFVNPSKNTVLVHESAMMPGIGGPAGTAGEYSLAEISAELVQKHIVSVLARAMGIGKVKRSAKAPRALQSIRRRNYDEPIPAAFNYLSR